MFVFDHDAHCPAQPVEKLIELQPANGREAVAVDVDALIPVNDALDRPAFKLRRKLLIQIRRVTLEERQRIQRKHHAKTESDVGRILLEDTDAPRRKPTLDQQRKQKTGGTGADDVNKHGKIGVLEYWRNEVMGLNPIPQHSSTPSLQFLHFPCSPYSRLTNPLASISRKRRGSTNSFGSTPRTRGLVSATCVKPSFITSMSG